MEESNQEAEGNETRARLHPAIIAVVAGFGGTLPTLARLGATYVDSPATPMPEWGLYFGLGIFFIIGSMLALASGEKTARQALVIGISAPAIISSVNVGLREAHETVDKRLSHIESVDPTMDKKAYGGYFSLINSAYAEPPLNLDSRLVRKSVKTPAVPTKIQARKLFGERRLSMHIVFTPRDGLAVREKDSTNLDDITIRFFDESGSSIGPDYKLDRSHKLSISSPISARGYVLSSKGNQKRVMLPSGAFALVEHDIRIEVVPGTDFLWALGYSRKLDDVNVHVDQKVHGQMYLADSIAACCKDYILGTDISHHQKSVNFDDLYKFGLRFVIMRATYGATVDKNVDSFWKSYSSSSNPDKLAIGFYHFFRYGQSVEDQASAFLRVISSKQASTQFPPSITVGRNKYDKSIETDEQVREYSSQVETFVRKIRDKTGRDPILMIEQDHPARFSLAERLKDIKVWGQSFDEAPPSFDGFSKMVLWQIGVEKFTSASDFFAIDVFVGSSSDYHALTTR